MRRKLCTGKKRKGDLGGCAQPNVLPREESEQSFLQVGMLGCVEISVFAVSREFLGQEERREGARSAGRGPRDSAECGTWVCAWRGFDALMAR